MDRPDVEAAREKSRQAAGFKDGAGNLLPLHGPLAELGSAGVGVELLFRTIRWSLVIFSVAFVVSIATLADNGSTPVPGEESGIVHLSIGPYQNKTRHSLVYLQGVPTFIIMVIFLFFLYWIRLKQRSVAQMVDHRYITSADFTVEVREIPFALSSEQQLGTFFSQFGKVVHVGVGYKCGAYVAALNKWKKLDISRTETIARRATAEQQAAQSRESVVVQVAEQFLLASANKVAEIEAEMATIEVEMHRLRTGQESAATGTAYVTFDTEDGRRAALRAHNPDALEKLLQCLGCVRVIPVYANAHSLRVSPASEPSDVYWENLEVGPSEVNKRTVRTLAISAGLICLSALLIWGLELLKDSQIEANRANGVSSQTYARGVAVAASAVVTTVNSGLRLAIIQLTHFERRDTRTEYELSLFYKLSFAYVINQSLLVLIISPNPASWYTSDGVIAQAFWIAFANMIVPEALKVLRFDVFMRRYVVGPLSQSQARLDEVWSPPEATLGEFYAGLAKTYALGLIYGPAMPLVWLFCCLALMAAYAANKYALLRVCKRPPAINEGLSEAFRTFISLLILISILVQFGIYGLYYGDAPGGRNPMPFLAFFAWAFYFVVPVRLLPCCRDYVDLTSNDAMGVTYSSRPGLVKFVCPIVQEVPSHRDAVRAAPREAVLVERPPEPAPAAAAPPLPLRPDAVQVETTSQGPRGLSLIRQFTIGTLRAQAEQPAPPQPPQHPGPSLEEGRQPSRLPQPPPPGRSQAGPQPSQLGPQPQVAPAPSNYVQPQRPPMLLSVICPPSAYPGAQILVQGPDNLYHVVVPGGVYPGSVFHVSV